MKKYRTHEKFFHYKIAPRFPEKSPPSADNLPVKICPARAAAGRGGFLPVNCRSKEETFRNGERSYNGTPAGRYAVYRSPVAIKSQPPPWPGHDVSAGCFFSRHTPRRSVIECDKDRQASNWL